MIKLKTPQDVRRRNFLKTAASSSIAASALKASSLGLALTVSRAHALSPQDPVGPNGIRRCVIVYIPNGAAPGTYQFNSDGSLGPSAAALESVKDNIVIFEGCETAGNGHSDSGVGVLAGTRTSENTYDTLLENFIGQQTPFKSLHLGIETTTGGPTISRRDSASVTFIDNPRTAFTQLFGDTIGEVLETDGMLKEPYSHNLAELEALKSKLGPQELLRIEEHEAAILKAMADLESQVNVGCDNPVQNTHGWDDSGSNPEKGQFTQVSNQQCDTTALALKCGLTNLVTLSFGTDEADFTASELAHLGTYRTAISSGNTNSYIQYRNYLSERLAYLINTLKTTTDENGDSLLDTTIVLQVTAMGNGDARDKVNAPFTMATGSKNMIGGRGVRVAHSHSLLDTVSYALGVEGIMPQYADGAVPDLLL